MQACFLLVLLQFFVSLYEGNAWQGDILRRLYAVAQLGITTADSAVSAGLQAVWACVLQHAQHFLWLTFAGIRSHSASAASSARIPVWATHTLQQRQSQWSS